MSSGLEFGPRKRRLTELARLLLPGMVARRRGRIMLVASTAAFQPGPQMAVYCATKAYVLHRGEAVAYELRGTLGGDADVDRLGGEPQLHLKE